MDNNESDANGGGGPPIRFQGDEPELYLDFNHRLVKGLQKRVCGAEPQDVEDAAGFAWMQFFRYLPDRDGEWEGWLYRTAQRELWRLTAARRRDLRIVLPGRMGINNGSEPADPRDRLDERLDLLAAIDEVRSPNGCARSSSFAPRSAGSVTSPRSCASTPRASSAPAAVGVRAGARGASRRARAPVRQSACGAPA